MAVNRTRVRSLYDSEAVLRQTAGILRELGWSESSGRFTEHVPSANLSTERREMALARRASLLAALRRSRELLDTVSRALESRALKRGDAQ